MALRQLATGAGDGCSADGSGGDASSAAGPSNPLGGFADALLGRPSKAHERAHEVRLSSGGLGSVRGRGGSEGLAVIVRRRRTNALSLMKEKLNLVLSLKKRKNQLPGLGRPMPGPGGMHRPGDAAAAIAAAEGK